MTQTTTKPAATNPLLAVGRRISTPEGEGVISAATPEQVIVDFGSDTVRYYPPAALLGPMTGREYLHDPFAKPEDTRYPFRVWAADPNLVVLAISASDLMGEVVEAAAIGADGKPLFDMLVKPFGPIAAGAAGYHGIDDAAAGQAKPIFTAWTQIWPRLKGKTVVVYNADYLAGRLAFSMDCARPGWRDTNNVLLGSSNWRIFTGFVALLGCVQSAYAATAGAFDQRYGSYSFIRLPAALAASGIAAPTPPRAAAVASAVLGLIKAVAAKGQDAPDPF